jgi:ferritin-like metal-binding protein YciE
MTPMAMTMTANLAGNETVQSIFITGLRNTHAFEKQADQMMRRQVERYENYPELSRILQQHIAETEQQIQRLEEILHSFGEDRSMFKDAVTQLVGNVAALFHGAADDEILKNLYANHAVEAYEIAAYNSLITITEAAGHGKFVSLLQQSLREEENAARLVLEQVKPLTMRYLELEARGAQANR